MKKINFMFLPIVVLVILLIVFSGNRKPDEKDSPFYNYSLKDSKGLGYPVHKDITVTIFWIGEAADEDNWFISNTESAWDSHWVTSFGGIDNPYQRNGLTPRGFIPLENPFYFALPYNDLEGDGKRKENAEDMIYWYDEKNWKENESLLKNRWIKIINPDNNKTAYAQWEDVGPLEEDDSEYVFGKAKPKNLLNNNAGLDVSPAVRDYLSLRDIDNVNWQFIEAGEVPEGPWTTTITTSQIFWD